MRPSFEQIYMDLAASMSKRSTCERLQVGCVVTTVDHRKVLAVGYNGNASGLPNKCDQHKEGACGCLHAECNAVINCDAPRELKKVIYITHAPCTTCSKMIINLGNVWKVIYLEDYRDSSGTNLLKKSNISAYRFSDLNGETQE